ncbi:MAG TPA: efflux RND transporter periplasmic adaptor subunit [Spirochaetota bacterium]|nr:efflux RND transporter periplasmic adaptor subunit [Spirochaetota bacterium]
MKKNIVAPVVLAVAVLSVTLYFEVFRNRGEDQNRITGSGTIEVTEIDISSKISGRVVELTRAEGDTVHKNDLLVRLEFDELSAIKNSALAGLVNAEKNFRRIRGLFETGSVSRREYDNAEAAYSMARAALDNVNAAIKYAVIYSPIDGTVLDTNIEAGEMAFPGTAIVTVADLTRAWMYVYVNESRLGQVKVGQKVNVTVDSFKNRVFGGRVVSISNKAEFTPKTIQTKDERVKLVFAVKVVIDNQDMSLKPGMPADAEIITGKEK